MNELFLFYTYYIPLFHLIGLLGTLYPLFNNENLRTYHALKYTLLFLLFLKIYIEVS